MATLTPAHEHELRSRGWTVIRAFTDSAATASARTLTDTILGGPELRATVNLEQSDGAEPPRGQPGPWPADGSTLPVIQSGGGWRHSIMHPIPDGPLMAQFVPPMALLFAALLRCKPTELKLLKQQLVRVDAEPETEQRPSKWYLTKHTTGSSLTVRCTFCYCWAAGITAWLCWLLRRLRCAALT